MQHGVRFLMPHNVLIDHDVQIGSGTVIGTGVHLLNGTKIGADCTIESFSTIKNCTLENNVTIRSHTVLSDSIIKTETQIGPFAHISSNSSIGTQSEIGNFVEVKRSNIAHKTKAKHLSYLGDSTIGSHVNIGAGTITCNYDGKRKHKTTIQDSVFVGSNNTLIAPLTINKGAYTAAGSTITHNVPENALAIARAQQVIKENYAPKLKQPSEPEKNNSRNNDDSDMLFMGAQKADSETML